MRTFYHSKCTSFVLVNKKYNSEKKIARRLRHFFLEVPRHIVVEIHHRFFEMPKTQGPVSPGRKSLLIPQSASPNAPGDQIQQ
jgi:hypothetical protein